MADTDTRQTSTQQKHPVRPRLSWGGTLLAVLGVIGIGVFMAFGQNVLMWISVAVTVVGLLLAWRGGVTADVHSAGKSPQEEIQEAIHGGKHEGIAPVDRVDSDRARERAVAANQISRALMEERVGYRPPMAPLMVLVLLAAGVWLLISRGALRYPYNSVGQAASVRDLGFGLVVFLAALWLRQVGPSRVAGGLCLLSGVGLVLCGALVQHTSGLVQANELAMGALVLIASAVALTGRYDDRA